MQTILGLREQTLQVARMSDIHSDMMVANKVLQANVRLWQHPMDCTWDTGTTVCTY